MARLDLDWERPLVGGFFPRAFQSRAESQVMEDLCSGVQRALVTSPTGTGKTELAFMIARNFKRRLLAFPGKGLTHQTVQRARVRWPDASVDLEQGFNHAAGDSDTICATAQSLMSKDRYQKFLGKVDIVCVDEAHWGFTESQNKMLDQFVDAGAKVVGFTATPFVGAKGGILSWWEKVSFSYTIREATDDGLLVPSVVTQLRCKSMDLSSFKVGLSGDFNKVELDEILRREKVVLEMSEAIAQHYDGLCTVVFCHSIKQAESMKDVLLNRYGIGTSLVHSKMDDEEREAEMRRFFDGDNPVILNVGVLVLGFDWPHVRNVVMCKPTASRARYMQIYGRGTRPLPGLIDNPTWTAEQRKAAIAASAKPNFMVWDMTDNCRSHTLQTALDVLAPPEASEEVKRRVSSRIGGKTKVKTEEIDAALAEEMAEERRRLAAIYRLEHERRKGLKADAEFDRRTHDPYAPPAEKAKQQGKRAYMPFGDHKGKPVSAVPTDYLEWVRSCNKKGWLHKAVCAELDRRAAEARSKRQNAAGRPIAKAAPDAAIEEFWALQRGA